LLYLANGKYDGCLQHTTYRWLDINKLLQFVLPKNDITLIKYFTARVKPTSYDPDAPARQNVYLKALKAHIPHLEIIEGRFLRVTTTVEPRPGKFVRGQKSEEKGSDVNIAVHLLNDAWLNLYDVGVLVSNDTDLAQAMALVQRDCGKTVGLVSPVVHKVPKEHSEERSSQGATSRPDTGYRPTQTQEMEYKVEPCLCARAISR